MLQYGYLLPRHPLDYNSVWDCTDCDNSQANEVIASKLGKFEEQIEALEKDKVVLLMIVWPCESQFYVLTGPRQIFSVRRVC